MADIIVGGLPTWRLKYVLYCDLLLFEADWWFATSHLFIYVLFLIFCVIMIGFNNSDTDGVGDEDTFGSRRF